MPPQYGDVMGSLGRSHDEELLVRLMKEKAAKPLIPKRYWFSFLAFTACILAVTYNINLSITIVSMVRIYDETPNNTMDFDFTWTNTSNKTGTMQFDWDANIVSLALGAVYYGQLVSFIPGGRMAELFGGKIMLLLCMFLSSVATIVSPFAAMWNSYAFIVSRILVGVGTGPIIPIIFYMLARWIPESERSFHASFILSGYGVGSFLAVIISGALCATTVLYGWPLVFYSGGIFGLIWVLYCSYMMYETPDHHPTISEEEYCLIMARKSSNGREEPLRVPWKQMILSVPLWALAVGFFGQFWLLGFFSTVHASYMGAVLDLPIAKNGVLSCLPHLLRAFATCLASYPVDIMLKKEVVSIGFVRKGATLINSLVSCAAFYAITLVGRNVTATTLLFILGGVLGEFVTFGVCMACVDIAPNLSGTVSGIINIVGVFPFIIIPEFVGWMTNYENSIEQWQQVFYASIAVVLATTFIFVIFGDLRPQSWGVSPESKVRTQADYEIIGGSDNVHTSPKSGEEERVLL